VVRLDRIYTRAGDAGETSLGDGERTRKSAPRVRAYGAVDELNAFLGVALAAGLDADAAALLARVQNDLFDVGADLSVPLETTRGHGKSRLRIGGAHVQALEQACDRWNEQLEPLRSFVLPGGSAAAAALHVARTVCRRAEREAVALAESEEVNGEALAYLNRLSDLLFILARHANDRGRADVLWQPGATLEP
jgi:cob(I)alamin adenosyltransferase